TSGHTDSRQDNHTTGGSVTLTCSVEDPAGLKYEWFRQTSDTSRKTPLQVENFDDSHTVITHGGRYTCRGWRREPEVLTPESDPVTIQETVSNRASLTLQPNWPQIFSGEKITLRCEIDGGGDTQWTYEWKPDKLNIPPRHSEYRINSVTRSHSGEYRCKGRKDSYSSTEWSNVIRLNVSPNKPKPTLTAHNAIIPVGGTVTLTCSVRGSADWKYYWFKRTSDSSVAQPIRDGVPDSISVSQGGLYHCRGGRGDPLFFTENSDKVTIQETVSNRASLTLQPNWPQIFRGETITIRCEIDGGRDSHWTYEWTTTSSNTQSPTHSEYRIISATVSNSGEYRCKGRKDSYSSTEWSEAITLTVSSQTPKAQLRADDTDIPVGGSVTLTCSVNPSSSGWKYFWYRGKKTSEPLTTPDVVFLSTGQIRVSQGGLYWCRGGRGDPVYYTDYRDPISINTISESGICF
uniref:Ig-like domain-containing protein n=1 Tax=Dicentrarchus labrax TaxID=13489 RepID=A0A8P4JZL9_DICLA